MKAGGRLKIIMDKVQTNEIVEVAEISGRLECFEVVIRDDIEKLGQQGVLKKAHGGAICKENRPLVEFIPKGYFLNSDKKYRITRRAYEYTKGGGLIIIDDSTTGYYLTKHIKGHTEKHLAVVTDPILFGAKLTSARHVGLFIVGGHVIGNPLAAPGNITVGATEQFHVNRVFAGASGINLKTDPTSIGAPRVNVKCEMIRVADEVYAITDSSEFGSRDLFTACPMSEVDRMITGIETKKEHIQVARSLGVKLGLIRWGVKIRGL